jgi:ribosomal protein S18 acetylase RimI-like enzyme
MVNIRPAEEDDALILSDIGRRSFIDSHWKSAPPESIESYVINNYNVEHFRSQLSDPANLYYLLELYNVAAGYSCITLNTQSDSIPLTNIAKLDRLYLLKEYYDKGMGQKLFNHNVRLCKENNQTGLWLFVWKKNYRAISFYLKMGCIIVGTQDFWLTPNHANPNYIMLLLF